MPAKSEIDAESFLQHLKNVSKHELFNDQGRLKSENDVVWRRIKEDLGYSQQSKSIQSYLRQNRNFVLSSLKEFFGIEEPSDENFKAELCKAKSRKKLPTQKNLEKCGYIDQEISESDCSEGFDSYSDDNAEDDFVQAAYLRLKVKKPPALPKDDMSGNEYGDKNLSITNINSTDLGVDCYWNIPDEEDEDYKYFVRNMIKYSVVIPDNVWNIIRPIATKNKKGQEYYRFSQGWCDVVYDLLWSTSEENHRIPCVINFRNSYIYKTICKYGIRVTGYCKECGNKILMRCKQNPLLHKNCSNLSFEIKTYNSKGLPHNLKRRVIGVERDRVLRDLWKKLPLEYQNGKAELLVKNGVEPAHLYNLVCLQKIKSRERIESLGIKYCKNVFDSLDNLKCSSKYGHLIKLVGHDKFYVFYILPEQVDFFKDFIKYGLPISIDASGSVVHKIKRGDGLSGHIFIYVIVAHIGNKIVPLCQMLSEQHDMGFIKYWLEWWSRQINSRYVPREVVTDMAPALQNAICLEFNRLTYPEYLLVCFEYIKKQSSILPLCWLRIDIAHLIVAVTRWPCLHGKEKRRCKDFYTRCVGYLSTLENLAEIAKVVRYVLAIADTKYDEEDPEIMIAREYLLNIFQTSYKHEDNLKEVYKGTSFYHIFTEGFFFNT